MLATAVGNTCHTNSAELQLSHTRAKSKEQTATIADFQYMDDCAGVMDSA